MCGAAANESKAFREEVFIESQHWAYVSPWIIVFSPYRCLTLKHSAEVWFKWLGQENR